VSAGGDPAVCVGSPAPFHTFDLARRLAAKGRLRRLYTAHPRWRVPPELRAHVRTRTRVLLPREGLRRAGPPGAALGGRLDGVLQRDFDRWMAAALEPCDVFHCLSGFGVAAHEAARARFGAVTICDRGSTHIREQERLLREEYARWGVPFAGIPAATIDRELAEYEACDAVVVPSAFARRSFVDHGVPADRVYTVPYGVDLTLFRPTGQPPPSRFTVLFVGQVGVRKGVGHLLEAVRRLRAGGGGRAADVLLAGPVEPAARGLLRPFEGSIRLLGPVPRARLAEVYARASVLVLPSVEEGLALVQAQAMACGVPVVATTSTGAEDLFTDGREGFIVAARDPDALTERLERLRADPDLRAEMGRAALRRARALKGWSVYADGVLDVYRSLLGERA
jgi:glycosyltransferase involved in cell wall biosynthesis